MVLFLLLVIARVRALSDVDAIVVFYSPSFLIFIWISPSFADIQDPSVLLNWHNWLSLGSWRLFELSN